MFLLWLNLRLISLTGLSRDRERDNRDHPRTERDPHPVAPREKEGAAVGGAGRDRDSSQRDSREKDRAPRDRPLARDREKERNAPGGGRERDRRRHDDRDHRRRR